MRKPGVGRCRQLLVTFEGDGQLADDQEGIVKLCRPFPGGWQAIVKLCRPLLAV